MAIAKPKGHFLSFPDNVNPHYDPNKENASAFISRELFYTINVQAVCTSNAFITNIYVPFGYVRLARYRGKMYSGHISFQYGGLCKPLSF